MQIRRLSLFFTFVVCTLSASLAQTQKSAEKGIQFLGQIQTVDFSHKTVTVKHGSIPGFADRGGADYPVDDDSILKRLQPGDDIRATVYPNDHTLHRIRIVSHGRLNQQKQGNQ